MTRFLSAFVFVVINRILCLTLINQKVNLIYLIVLSSAFQFILWGLGYLDSGCMSVSIQLHITLGIGCSSEDASTEQHLSESGPDSQSEYIT